MGRREKDVGRRGRELGRVEGRGRMEEGEEGWKRERKDRRMEDSEEERREDEMEER